MKAIKTWAIVLEQFEACHQWVDAPESEGYLRSLHRHLFTVEMWIEQKHNDRDIEYYNFKKYLYTRIRQLVKVPTYSCENYCDAIQSSIEVDYPGRDMKITVREDGLEGACKEYVCK